MTGIAKARAGALDEARWIDLPSRADSRGVLTAIEGGRDIPFEIRRVYLLHGIVQDRGGHAHRDTYQVVTAAAGTFEMVLSDGQQTRTYRLDTPTRGLLIVPMLFIRMQRFSADARVMVMASTHYDPARSIRSWDDYLAAVAP